MKNKLITILLTGFCLDLARADFNPVAITPGSYTYDIVVESNTLPALPYVVTASVGGGTSLGDSTFFERGLYDRTGGGYYCGVPLHNTVFTNQNNANITYQMPPDYTVNNGLLIDSGVTSGSLTLNTPTTATSLSILDTGGNGGVTVNYTVNHQDGVTTETGSYNPGDWFGGANPAWICGGRVGTPNGGYSAIDTTGTAAGGSSGANPRMYSKIIAVSSASPVTSISFTYSSGGGHDCFFAVSANNGGSTWTPVSISGFNEILIDPAIPVASFPVSATMDQGTNLAQNGNLNTWFEQGYIRGTPGVGLPPSGSIFNSQAQSTHHYQMGNYSANNSILIDTNHQVSTIVPTAPAVYTAFAFLTAGANDGTPMQDLCILQHADGVNETNLFYGYDWFYNNAPGSLAFKSNGRVNLSDRSLNNVNNNYPYLFETYFTLSDLTSPVTNIIVEYKSASSVSSTTYIMAISASTNPVPAVITAGPTPAQQTWFATQTAAISVQVAGSQPLTNKWMIDQNGTYVPLSDGTDAHGSIISGSSTTTLTIKNLSTADGTNYIYIASNSAGTATSAVATVSIRTGIAGVVPIPGWNNIANQTFIPGNSTNITSADGTLTASLNLVGSQITNGYSSGIVGDGGNASLMEGYMDVMKPGAAAPTISVSSLPGSSYNLYIYTFSDATRPGSSTDQLPNYAVNGTIYYAPVLGGTGASRYNSTSNSIGGIGFTGFVASTVTNANDSTAELGTNEFGNYIVISNVVPSSGAIQIIPEADFNSFRSPLNGIELVDTSNSSDNWGIHFLGATSDRVSGTPLAPVIDSQAPSNTLYVLTNHPVVSTFSVSVDGASSVPISYQWYSVSPLNVTQAIASATNSTLASVDTNNVTYYCVVTNFVGSATSIPVAVDIVQPPTPSQYSSAVLALHPVAYWPLTEISGNIAFDYAGTNDGVYNGSYQLGQNGLPATPGIGANSSVYFDGSSAYVDIPSSGGHGDLNIVGPVTCIEWVLVPGSSEPGFGTCLGHSDQNYRLSVINASGNPAQARFADPGPDLLDNTSIGDGNWHQLVGVFDGSKEYLYVDAKLVGSSSASAPAGSSDDVMIGAAPDYLGSRNFQGNIAQVAIYNTALTQAQISQIYGSVDTAPLVAIVPASPSVYSGNNVTLTANLSGTPATKLQWFYIDTSNNSNSIAGATNSTYTIVAPPPSFNGYTYGVIAGNPYGTNIATATLSVSTAQASLVSDVGPAFGEAYVGAPATYSVYAVGSLPINYQWTLNNVPVANATNATFTLSTPCGTNLVQVSFTNLYSAGTPVVSSQATLVGDAVPPMITFNTNGTGWVLQGAGFTPTINTNTLELTDNNGSEGTCAFYVMGQYVDSFNASFNYIASGNQAADGTCFIIQNSATGTNALGAGGGGLGYSGISNSVALEINLYQIVGIAFGTNGDTYGNGGGSIYTGTGQVLVNSGDPIRFALNWANGILTVNLTDTVVPSETYTTNYAVGPLEAITGSSLGYIGFSGGDGGATSIQTVSNFQFQSVIPPIALSASFTNHNFVISWPAADPNYVLQTNSSLSLPNNWGDVSITPVMANGMDIATIPGVGGTKSLFYRLQRVVCQ